MFGREKRLQIKLIDERFANVIHTEITPETVIDYGKFLRKVYLAYLDKMYENNKIAIRDTNWHYEVRLMPRKMKNFSRLGQYYPNYKRTGRKILELQSAAIEQLDDGYTVRCAQDKYEQKFLREFRYDFPRFADTCTYVDSSGHIAQKDWLFIHNLLIHEMSHHWQFCVDPYDTSHSKLFGTCFTKLLTDFDFVLLFVNFVEKTYR